MADAKTRFLQHTTKYDGCHCWFGNSICLQDSKHFSSHLLNEPWQEQMSPFSSHSALTRHKFYLFKNDKQKNQNKWLI